MFSKLTVVAILIASVFAAQQCSRTYTIQAGDHCDTIGAANNASTYQIMVVNYPTVNAECTNLQPGGQLCLGYNDQDCKNTYVVQSGDTCDQVSANHGINNTILVGNNPQLNGDCLIYVGEVLCVANQVSQVTPPKGLVVPTSIPPTATAATAAETSSASGDGDEDDDDLPYCDEL